MFGKAEFIPLINTKVRNRRRTVKKGDQHYSKMALKIPKVPMKCMPMRMYISIIGCSGVILSFMLRFCISLCILRMVKIHKRQKFASDCFNSSETDHDHHHIDRPEEAEFDWSESQQGFILSSIFFSYFLFQVPAGYFSDMIGAVPITVGGMLVTSVTSVITPEVARWSGLIGLIILRLVMGAGQALSFIPLHGIINAWIPKKERNTWGAFIFSGSHLGSCFNNIFTGQLLRVCHWHWIFRLYGALGLVWVAVFLFTCYSYPDQCECLSEKEKKLLKEAGLMERKKHPTPPWLKIMTNAPIWAAVAGTFGHGWVLFSLMTDLPKFLKSVLHISLNTLSDLVETQRLKRDFREMVSSKQLAFSIISKDFGDDGSKNIIIDANSLVNAGMFILIWANAVASGPIVDLINKKQWVSLTWNRKIFLTTCSMPPALGLVWSVYTNCNVALAISMLVIGCSLMGYFYSSVKLNGIDMSPNYAGTVSSIVNALGTSAGFIATNVAGQLTPNEALKEWQIVMWIALAVMTVTNIIYLIWGSAEVQPFDSPQAEKEAKEKKDRKKEEKLRKEEARANDKGKQKTKKEADHPAATSSSESKKLELD